VTFAVTAAGAAILMCGCARDNPSSSGLPDRTQSVSTENLKEQLDEVLLATYAQRHLSLQEHAAWQILHGVLAYQQAFLVDNRGGRVSAVEHVLNGGSMKGWTMQIVADPETGQRGLRALLEPGSNTGQGHADQWLAILAQCGLELSQPIKIEDQVLTMSDYVRQVQWDVPRNLDREYSWTLIGLTSYLPTDATWTASDGQPWSIERLVEIETEQDLALSACGGTHRLIGLAMTLNRHREQGGQVEGVWSRAEAIIQEAIASAREYQNPDGSFSTRYFQGPGSSPDLAQNLGTTGHILEFLALALTDQQLQEPWVQRAAANLCELFRRTMEVPLECGALYHAAHGLVLYRERVFGPRDYVSSGDEADAS
jgi:hypothetical protein